MAEPTSRGGFLRKKWGPAPAWAWIGGGAAVVGYLYFRSKSSSSSTTATSNQAAGGGGTVSQPATASAPASSAPPLPPPSAPAGGGGGTDSDSGGGGSFQQGYQAGAQEILSLEQMILSMFPPGGQSTTPTTVPPNQPVTPGAVPQSVRGSGYGPTNPNYTGAIPATYPSGASFEFIPSVAALSALNQQGIPTFYEPAVGIFEPARGGVGLQPYTPQFLQASGQAPTS